MDAIYANVTFEKKRTSKQRAVGESSRDDPVLYSLSDPSDTSAQVGSDPGDPSPKTGSEVVTSGSVSVRHTVLLLSLCALLLGVATALGVVYVLKHNQLLRSEKNLTELRNEYDALNTKHNNQSQLVSALEINQTETWRILGQERESKRQLFNDKTNLDNQLKDYLNKTDTLISEKENMANQLKETQNRLEKQIINYNVLSQVKKSVENELKKTKGKEKLSEVKTSLENVLTALQTGCSVGWKTVESGKCYFFSSDEKSWNESRDACVTMGADLVILESAEEQSSLMKIKPGDGVQKYWIGLTDSVTEGDWRWVDNSQLSNSAKYWEGSEPDNWKGGNNDRPEGEDCAEMRLSKTRHEWKDAFCDIKMKSICEVNSSKMI